MILTAKSRYGVMAMVDLALQKNLYPVNLKEISERQQIAIKYLEQIFNKLKKCQLVVSIKGPGGGYYLSKPAANIYVADIIAALEEPLKMTRCNNKMRKSCLSDKSRCMTHDLWDGLTKQIQKYFDSVNLQDICDKSFNKNSGFSAKIEVI